MRMLSESRTETAQRRASGQDCEAGRWLPVASRCLLVAILWLALTTAFVAQENDRSEQPPTDDQPTASPFVVEGADDHSPDRPKKARRTKGPAPSDPLESDGRPAVSPMG